MNWALHLIGITVFRIGDIDIPDPGEEEDEEAIIERRRKEREALLQVGTVIATTQKNILKIPKRRHTFLCRKTTSGTFLQRLKVQTGEDSMTGMSTPGTQSSASSSSSDSVEHQEEPEEFDWMESLNTKISNVKEGRKISVEEKKAEGGGNSGGFDMFAENNDMFSEKYNVRKENKSC